MIFGFGKKRADDDDDDDDDELEEEEPKVLVSFEGPYNKVEIDLETNARLVQAALIPAKESISEAIRQRAEFMRMEIKGSAAVTAMAIDGMPYAGEKMPKQKGLAIIQMLKLLGGMDIRERTKPQSGALSAKYEDVPYELRLDTTPMQDGTERLQIRFRNLKDKLYAPTDLGIPEDVIAKIKEFGANKQGLMLVAGPPRSGTTTTLFAAVRCIDAYLYNVISIADATGRELRYLTEMKPNEGEDLSATLDRVLRMESDAVFLDPINDGEQLKAIYARQENSAFMTEVTAKDAAHAVEVVVGLMGDPKPVAEMLKGVLSQKLIRKLCEKCREAYKPNGALLAKLGLPDNIKKFYRPPVEREIPEGEEPPPICSKCGGADYMGRVAMFEFIEVTPEMQQVIAGGGKADDIRAQARKEKMLTLQRDGLRLVVEGKTSLEELQRVFRG